MPDRNVELIAPLQSSLPRPFLRSLVDLAQQAFETGHTRMGEQLLNLVNESYSVR